MAIELPQGYYLDNFQKLIGFVYEHYADLLTDEEKLFYPDFQKLSPEAQRLYVRMISRKGPYFRSDKLNYEEIPDISSTLQLLKNSEFAAINPSIEPSLFYNLLLRDELLQLGEECPPPDPRQRGRFETAISLQQEEFDLQPCTHSTKTVFPLLRGLGGGKLKKMTKPELVQYLTENVDIESAYEIVSQWFSWVEPLRMSELLIYRLCFFGNLRQDLTEFVLLDLGMIRYENYEIHQEDRYFQNRVLLDKTLQMILLRELQEDILASNDVESFFRYYQMLPPHDNEPGLMRRHSRIANNLARQLERLGEPDKAIELYDKSILPPARERKARILAKLNRIEESLQLCDAISQAPLNEEELEFAEGFSHRLKKKHGIDTKPALQIAVNNEVLVIEDKTEENVELQTAAYLQKQGYQAFYVENHLFVGLFGLAFWDIIFMPLRGAFFNLYQRGPKGLFSSDFRQQRQREIEERLELIRNDEAWPEMVKKTYQEKNGISNYLIYWPNFDENLFELSLNRIPRKHLANIFDRLSYDLKNNATGFPDLIIFPPDEGYELIEVKGPGDRVQKNQKRWMKYFNEFGVPYRVIHVKYDRNQ